MKPLTKTYIRALLKPRSQTSSKHDHGHALVLAGNVGRMGAALIAAKACLRCGAGLVTVNVPKKERLILQTGIPEAMLMLREEKTKSYDKFTALAIGPGLGAGKKEKELLLDLLTGVHKPLLLDADALNLIAANKLFAKIPPGTILTPHRYEFDRLFGKHQNRDEQIKTAAKKAKELRLIIVLKGPKTVIATPTGSYSNTTGNAGLAKGGTGDGLSGSIVSFLAQGYEPPVAAQLGVYLHGLAADLCLQEQSVESLLVSDLIECFGKAFLWLRK